MSSDEERADSLLRDLSEGRLETFLVADIYLNKGCLERDRLASAAGADHRDRSKALFDLWSTTKDIDDVLERLKQDLNHAERCQLKFDELRKGPGEYDEHLNGYVSFVHGEAADSYRGVLDRLNKLKPQLVNSVNLEVPAQPSLDLLQTFATTGGVDGFWERRFDTSEE